ncbi:MAG TPA: cupredoxin family copper-binding protein [Solirubrobacterales bacterium]|nr:cupredoxin family copper-binding protein [Solirubrobacterales bacterium]
MKIRALLIPVLLALALGLAACGSDDSSDTSGAATSGSTESETTPGGEAARSEKVEIVEFAYQPEPVVVAAGGKVTWQNEDSAPHTATADDGTFDTGTLDKGKLKSETFKEAGTFPYFCEIHPTMHGTVEVVE